MSLKAIDAQKKAIKQKIIESKGDIVLRMWKPAWPAHAISGKPYTGFGNILTLLFEAMEKGYASPYWLSMSQIKRHELKLKKGESHTWVLGWFSPKSSSDDSDDGDDGSEKQQHRKLLCRAYRVYNTDQLEDASPLKLDGSLPATREMSKCVELIGKMGVGFNEVYGESCFYRRSTDAITSVPLSNYFKSEYACAVLLHEIAHATGHPDRLNRPLHEKRGDEIYCREEVIAETCALVLCTYFGIQKDESHAASYIKGWLSGNPECLDEAIDAAFDAFKFIKPFIDELDCKQSDQSKAVA